jgi:hypothetical protein
MGPPGPVTEFPSYYISSKGLPGECDKEENLEVTGAANTSCLKRRM